jgi:hypothetical protein
MKKSVARNKKQKKSAKKGSRKKADGLLQKQWTIPAGFHADGSAAATLQQVLDPAVPTLHLNDLTLQQQAELVAKRLAMQSKVELAMVGAGMIDKARAISEVKRKTKVGKLLIEIEHQMIRNLIEQAQKKNSKYAAASRPKRRAKTN